MNKPTQGIAGKLESFYEKYPGENFGIATVILLMITVGTSIVLYTRIDPTFSFLTHYVSGLGGPPKGAPPEISYLSATIYNLGMLLASPLRVAFLFQVVLFIRQKGAGIWASRASMATGVIASLGFLLMALVPFSLQLDLHMAGAMVYFLGATSFQLVFAVTELRTMGIPRYLPAIGLINLVVFSVFSHQLILVEVLQTPGVPEPAFIEWLVFGSAMLWVLAHSYYISMNRRARAGAFMNPSEENGK
jgi:hypothetical membrane protein